MADKWHSPVGRVCETCGSAFTVQYQTTQRMGGGRYCSPTCNPRVKDVARSRVALTIGAKSAPSLTYRAPGADGTSRRG